MRKIKSIYLIFVAFLVMIVASLTIQYWYSTANLKNSLMNVANIQIEYSTTLLNQKIKEIEIEADGILNSEDLKALQLCQNDEEYDLYDYVMCVNSLKEFLKHRQKSNVGMAKFIIYWPESRRTISTGVSNTDDIQMLERLTEDKWFYYKSNVYFTRRYRTDWDDKDDEPYLVIQMERDYLYRLKSMAMDMETQEGGTFMVLPNGRNMFSVNETEKEIYKKVKQNKSDDTAYEVQINGQKYQILEAAPTLNGLRMITYYPLREMLRPVRNIAGITSGFLAVLMLVGLLFMILFYKNILLQFKILTEHLKQVENGNFETQITELPNNEFAYVFEQFNRMVERIRHLISSTLKEQQLRNQAEMRQLQLQIHPHFLYNSLSYIVTVADKPQAVTQMAAHLADYYCYCTRNRSVATIGEEVAYARAYLSIMAIRKNIEYSISVSEGLEKIQVPNLLLQPIIENAIEHGIEGRENARHVYVKIYRLPRGNIRFEISDDGEGMSEDMIRVLTQRLAKREHEEETGIGLWNVNQRLINLYDASARLHFGKSVWGGMTVSFMIAPKEYGNESIDC